MKEKVKELQEGLKEMYEGDRLIIDAGICDFGWALKQMKDNKMVCRAAWRSNSCMFLIKGRTVEYNTFQKFKNNACRAFDPPVDIEIEDHIDAKHDGKYVTGFTPSQADILAEDWEIYEVER